MDFVVCLVSSKSHKINHIANHIVQCHGSNYKCPIRGCRRTEEMTKKTFFSHFNRCHFMQEARINKDYSECCYSSTSVENNDNPAQNLTTIIDGMLYDFITNNPATDKCYLSVLKLVENLEEVSKSFNLLFALKDSFLKKEILNKNMELNTKKIDQFNFEMCGPSSNIYKKQKFINKKSEIIYINLKKDIEQYLTKINGSSLIKDTCIDAILYVDDLNPNRDISSHSKNSAITNMAYRLVLNKSTSPYNFYISIANLCKDHNCNSLVSVLNSQYFNINTERKKIFKKSHFQLSGIQQIQLMKVFYFYLKRYKNEKSGSSSHDIIVTCILYLTESLCDLWFML
uniref:C2H2-type domain-containing protein n=1 Tax=Strongyloides venezuelensis TaxID=75913 RepID=A0A0K0FRT1_STRVS